MSNFVLCLCVCTVIAVMIIGLMMAVRSLEENEFNRDNLQLDTKIYGGVVGVFLFAATLSDAYMEEAISGPLHLALLSLFIVVTVMAFAVIAVTLTSHHREFVQ